MLQYFSDPVDSLLKPAIDVRITELGNAWIWWQDEEDIPTTGYLQTLRDASLLHSPFLVSSRNAPPWGGALRDDTKNGCVAD